MDVIKEILSLKQSHYECEDGWYSCPLSSEGTFNEMKDQDVCDCGADEHNAKVDAIVDELRRLGVKESTADSPASPVQQLKAEIPQNIMERLEAVQCIVASPCDKEESRCAWDELDAIITELSAV